MTVSLCCLQCWTVCKGDTDTDSFTACFMDHIVVSEHSCCYDLWKQTNAGEPTVEHKLPLAPQCAPPTCEIFQSAGLGATFANASQLLPGLRGLLTTFKYDNFHIQSCFSNCFMDTVTDDGIRCKKSVVEEDFMF